MAQREAKGIKVQKTNRLSPLEIPSAGCMLCGGMRRRLSLAIALIANPKVLYLDEPSTGLDPETRQSLWTIVSRLKKDRSIVLTKE